MESSRKEIPLVEGEDYYREGTAIVFTAQYHLRRGYCCGSGCRHCPYRETEAAEADTAERLGSEENITGDAKEER